MKSGQAIFDFSSNNGTYEVGDGDTSFTTMWTRADRQSVYIYNDPTNIRAVALAERASSIESIKDARRFDYSSRSHRPRMGQIVLLENIQGAFAALKIIAIKDKHRGDSYDELTVEWAILPVGQRDFSHSEKLAVDGKQFSRRVLLTGAGFSKNWGGLLASEVKEWVFSHPEVQVRPSLKQLVLETESFEEALEIVRTGLFKEEDEKAFLSAINYTFNAMDENYRNPSQEVLPATINDLISSFCPGPVGRGCGFVFTLNQDLLLERIYGTQVDKQEFSIPGINWSTPPSPWPVFNDNIPIAYLSDEDGWEPPNLERSFNLIKLHGSINWRSSTNAAKLIMGTKKAQTLMKEPLFSWYYEVFRATLSAGDIALMVIGYSWNDDHINLVIETAIKEHGLKVFCWDVTSPKDMLRGKECEQTVISSSNLIGYSTKPLTEVMPHKPMNPETAEYDRIKEVFF